MKPGDKVRLAKKMPEDPTFHRRHLTVTNHRWTNGSWWCEWRERVDGRLNTFGNWFREADLVKVVPRGGKKRS